jgi:tRNA(Arg) A34 adenosine deaminase TadA
MQNTFMEEAIRLAIESAQSGLGGPFGAVVVKEGTIIGRGQNRVTSSNDPTAHAEILAIRDACDRLATFKLEGCALYASCEPCPMCLAAVYWARIEKVVFASTRADAEAIGFDDQWIWRELSRENPGRSIGMTQILRDAAQAAFEIWSRKEDKVPY